MGNYNNNFFEDNNLEKEPKKRKLKYSEIGAGVLAAGLGTGAAILYSSSSDDTATEENFDHEEALAQAQETSTPEEAAAAAANNSNTSQNPSPAATQPVAANPVAAASPQPQIAQPVPSQPAPSQPAPAPVVPRESQPNSQSGAPRHSQPHSQPGGPRSAERTPDAPIELNDMQIYADDVDNNTSGAIDYEHAAVVETGKAISPEGYYVMMALVKDEATGHTAVLTDQIDSRGERVPDGKVDLIITDNGEYIVLNDTQKFDLPDGDYYTVDDIGVLAGANADNPKLSEFVRNQGSSLYDQYDFLATPDVIDLDQMADDMPLNGEMPGSHKENPALKNNGNQLHIDEDDKDNGLTSPEVSPKDGAHDNSGHDTFDGPQHNVLDTPDYSANEAPPFDQPSMESFDSSSHVDMSAPESIDSFDI